jgi:hypothetical protein
MPEGDFRAIHAENARPATGCPPAGDHFISGQKAQFHEPPRHIVRQIQAIQNTALTRWQVREG